jgi:hypothetical protein
MRAWVRSWTWATIIGASPLFVAGQTSEPSSQPATIPTTPPASEPATIPSTLPSTEPTTFPTTAPATEPAILPATFPTTEPTTAPTTLPTTEPTTSPAATTQTSAVEALPLMGIVDGAFFPEQEGRLEQSKDGHEIRFIFEKDGKQMEAPVLQNLELMRLENAVEEAGWNLRFRASGWVTQYQGKNYILLDHASRVEEKKGSDVKESVR